MAPRRPFVGGNWKANGTTASIKSLVATLNASPVPDSVDVVIAPTALHIPYVLENVSTGYQVSAQDVWASDGYGAFTGSLTPAMVKDFGLNWTITGHSERRHKIAKESSELVADKTAKALAAGLKVIVCIGELLEDRKAGRTNEVCTAQLDPVVKAVPAEAWANGSIVVAYEPVWAIGTGETATPEQAEEVHCFLREYLEGVSEVGAAAEQLRIIYGGSVKAANSAALFAKPNIDGFLVGGASLKPEFADIIKSTYS